MGAASDPKSTGANSFEEKVVPFSDDAPKDAALFTFRNDLLTAVRAKDVNALLGALDPTIINGFDGQEGIDAFKAKWKLNDNPAASPVWKELGEVLRLGGTIEKVKDETQFTAPYVYSALPDSFDEFEHGIVVGDGVNVRAKPDESSQVVQKIGRIVVRLYAEESPKQTTLGGETFPWRKVGLPNGATGYIWGKYVRSPLDYRAGFSNQSGHWKMTFFLAGD
ncbi:MAG: SH3 domain-containing protein [Candidatus Hydrogenedentes bacterium]|nr:SH3 domain-containing protein [Candidatus Hydrogenedentota bacterium]